MGHTWRSPRRSLEVGLKKMALFFGWKMQVFLLEKCQDIECLHLYYIISFISYFIIFYCIYHIISYYVIQYHTGYHVLSCISSYHIVCICIFIQYTFYITLRCIISLLYHLNQCIFDDDDDDDLPFSVPASGPRITSISTGLPLSVPPLDRLFSHTAPCVRIMKDPPQHPRAHPSLQNQQCQDCRANKNSGGEKSDSFETKSKSNMSGMSLNRVIPLSICLTFRITRYHRSTNLY